MKLGCTVGVILSKYPFLSKLKLDRGEVMMLMRYHRMEALRTDEEIDEEYRKSIDVVKEKLGVSRKFLGPLPSLPANN